jgi:glucose-6-phosphate 1-dehydrogenase
VQDASSGTATLAPVVQHGPPVADPCTFVIFGATGDLAKRKLLPALYNLAFAGLLDDRFIIVGVGRERLSTDRYRQKIEADIRQFGPSSIDDRSVGRLVERSMYVGGEFDDERTYRQLATTLSGPGDARPENAFFYLATPPALFGEIVERLGGAGLMEEANGAWRRVVVEKPFGHDLASARDLNRRLLAVLRERQIYRIDHYLGKETVQNIIAFRFGNGIFEPIWNRRYIDHVQITVAEAGGVEQRGGYYDGAGALRDMVQNHLFQLLAVTAMEPPISFQADRVRDERLKVLQAMAPFTAESARRDVVRAQYAEGEVEGQVVPAYRREPKVADASTTETYVAMKVLVENWRWADVPFYLRTGKRLSERATEIAIQFKRAPLALFGHDPREPGHANWLVVRIQPCEGMSLRFQAKIPGPDVRLGSVDMQFSYSDHFGEAPNTGYETLLYDCMTGDATLFHRADIVDAGWQIVDPVLEAWAAAPRDGLAFYPAGTWGPAEAAALLAREGRSWRDPGS